MILKDGNVHNCQDKLECLDFYLNMLYSSLLCQCNVETLEPENIRAFNYLPDQTLWNEHMRVKHRQQQILAHLRGIPNIQQLQQDICRLHSSILTQ